MAETKKRRPFGFYVCALGFTFERLAFYCTKYIMSIWIATEVAKGGLGFDSEKAAAMGASFVAWTYITPLIGGYIADHFINPRICVALGMLLMGGGYIILWQAHSLTMVWIMIILVSIGTGFFKGNLSGITGLLFDDPDELNSAFSIQYSFVNIGSFCGTTFLAVTATTGLGPIHLTFNQVFLVCGIFMLLDLLWFVIGGRAFFGDKGKTPFMKGKKKTNVDKNAAQAENAPLTTGDKKRVFAVVLVTLFSGVFWMVWYMAYMPAYYHFGYGDGASFENVADWHLGGKLLSTSYFDSVNALVCIILGPLLAILWNKLAQRPKGDLSLFKKTGIGTILVGISYVVMVCANMIAQSKGPDGQCSVLWLLLVCVLMSVGEMVFSPLGNSFISKIAPPKLLGLLLGFWPLAVFLAQQVYPLVYAFLNTLPFNQGYMGLAIIVIALGLILYMFSGKLEALEKDDE